ncbi:MAG: glycosyltransferase family 4 protein [Candidatus Heimdallarchaeota archaeon]|nr:MAG: glycosyltransferase family 4 protein [Candidatus Heimdallarchaeota archaeon]
MKVNFILDMEKSLTGSGVYSSATRLAARLREHGIQTDINGNNPPYDIYHFQTSLPQSLWRARILTRRKDRKYQIVMTGHTTIEDFRNSFLFSNRIDFALVPYLTKFYSYADYLIAVSDYNRDILLRYGYESSRIHIISNGIDLSKNRKNPTLGLRAREFLGIPDNQLLVITVGLCIYRKAPDVFTNVAISVPEHQFLWIGRYLSLGTIAHSSQLRKKFQTARRAKNIRFTGYVSRLTLEALWNAADVFLYVSREENQGIALLESIAYGKVPVVRDHPVFNWLTHDKDCLKGKTREDFTKLIRKLASDRKMMENLRLNSELTLQAHDLNKSVEQLVNLYNEIS